MTYFEKVKKALVAKLEEGLKKNLEGEPILTLKNGKTLIIEETFGGKYNMGEDFGCTCYSLGHKMTIDEVVNKVIEMGRAS